MEKAMRIAGSRKQGLLAVLLATAALSVLAILVRDKAAQPLSARTDDVIGLSGTTGGIEQSELQRHNGFMRAAQNPSFQQFLTVSDCQIMVVDSARLGPARSGIVSSLSVREGDHVEIGQELFTLDSELARATLQRQRQESENDVELRYAKKVSEVARTEYLRALELNREISNAHSELQMNGLRLEAERALLQIEQAVNQMELSRLRMLEAETALAEYRVESPMRGIIQRVHHTAGEAVREGETLIEVASFERLRVSADVPLTEALQLRRGLRVIVTSDSSAYGPESASGKAHGQIVFVGSSVNEVSHTVQVWAEVDNRDAGLFAGLTGTMQVLTSSTNPSH